MQTAPLQVTSSPAINPVLALNINPMQPIASSHQVPIAADELVKQQVLRDQFTHALKQQYQSKWINPENWSAGLGTQLTKLLFDEGKSASIAGHMLGIPAGIAGGALTHSPWGAVAGVGLGLLAGVSSFFGQKRINNNYIDFILRNPLATMRDYLADPAVQTLEMGKAASAASRSTWTNTVLLARAFSR